MDEIEHFLKKDFRFYGFIRGLLGTKPGRELDDWMLEFYKGAYRHHNFKDDQALFNERCSQLGRYITLYDEECADGQGLCENFERIKKDWGSWHFVPSRGWVHRSLVPYELGQCRRASCSSHVDDGGGVALEPDSLKCKRTSGPSHVDDGGGDALQGISSERDRSIPVQSERFRVEVVRDNVDPTLEGF
jgi:hypothetical protein